ncbi:Bro-N domain-containing protein [Laribacter hongkongensis]|uniref:BRO-N domain-containing protein n=1 Tax=Laribacter hongkongensis TaxID=168471 RepID=UPI001EFD52AA|nr:Bro-N domain-containing protein [Laribacter hongkongensis]MCG9054735.1 Bro-N domain-containing protein [Laribacter hongkongensis]
MTYTAQSTSAPAVFSFESHSVRTIYRDGEIWFILNDVTEALAFSRGRDAARMLDDDEKGAHIVRTLGGEQELTIVNESGLYSLVLRSRKPEAKRFKKWVTSEVLPAIRKTGAYSTTRRTKAEPGSYLLTAGEVHHLHGVFCMVDMMRDTLRELEPPLRLLNAPIAPRVFDSWHEIGMFIGSLKKLRSHCDEHYRTIELRVLGH